MYKILQVNEGDGKNFDTFYQVVLVNESGSFTVILDNLEHDKASSFCESLNDILGKQNAV